MKRICLPALMLLLFVSVHAQTKLSGPYQIKVHVNGLTKKPLLVYLSYTDETTGKPILTYDSATVKNGVAIFKGTISAPIEASLSVSPRTVRKRENGNRLTFYLEARSLEVLPSDSISHSTISGGQFTKSYNRFINMNRLYNEKLNNLNGPIWANTDRNSVAYKNAVSQYQIVFNQWIYTANKDFIIRYAKTSPVALLALRLYIGFAIEYPKTADSLYNLLNADFKKMPVAKSIAAKIDAALSVDIGKQAPLFEAPDTLGKSVSLASFKGSYVLLDFWASWCVPCREDNPNLISNFNRYKKNSFTIVSVSLDRDNAKAAWLAAIRKDKIGFWTHLSNLQMFNDPIAKLYGVTGIPQNFLIDPNGKIIASGLRGEALTKKLEEIFGVK